MQPTDGLVRGAPVQDTGDAITVPVGDVTKGHVWNTLGVPLDVDAASLDISERWSIHRQAPAFDQLESKTEVFTTGIKVIDLLTPYVKGGKIPSVRWCRCRQDRAHPGDDLPRRRELRRRVGVRRCGRAHP